MKVVTSDTYGGLLIAAIALSFILDKGKENESRDVALLRLYKGSG